MKTQIDFFLIGSKDDDEEVRQFFKDHKVVSWQTQYLGFWNGNTMITVEYEVD